MSRSSTEAEYRSLAALTVEILWVKSLLTELHLAQPEVPKIWCDNVSIIHMSANPVLHARTKHIELDLYFVREKIARHEVVVNHVPSADQLADVFTKATLSPRFTKMRSRLTVDSLQVQNTSV